MNFRDVQLSRGCLLLSETDNHVDPEPRLLRVYYELRALAKRPLAGERQSYAATLMETCIPSR